MSRRRGLGTWLADLLIVLMLALVAIATLYPFLNTLAISFNNALDTSRGGITIYPREFTLQAYRTVLSNRMLYQGFLVSILRTVVGTPLTVLATGLLAFGLSKRHLKGRRLYTLLCVVVMYVNAGLIPNYILLQRLHLINTFWVYIIPNIIPPIVGAFWAIIMRAYFKTIPMEVEESVRIDGGGYFTVFFRFILPLSLPIIATVALFAGVLQWNSWYDAAIYVRKENLKPVQTILQMIINSVQYREALTKMGIVAQSYITANVINSRSITAATIIVTIVPIVLVYPFLQKYFISGVMIGSVKE
jgi:putative aldouronate transport system permease protein